MNEDTKGYNNVPKTKVLIIFSDNKSLYFLEGCNKRGY